MATMAAATAVATAEKPKFDLHAFGQQKMSDPGMTIVRPAAANSSDPTTSTSTNAAAATSTSSSSSAAAAGGVGGAAAAGTATHAALADAEVEGAVTLRVFAGKALVSPGALYKSIVATPQMTAMEIITRALERYGEKENPQDFNLVYRRADDDSGRRGSISKLFQGKPRAHILCDDECPVLVAEWFNDAPRRFELSRKAETLTKRWSAESVLGSIRRKSKERSSTHIWTINRNGDGGGHDAGSGSERGGDSPVPPH